MRFPVALPTAKLFSLLSDFIAITGIEPWERRRQELQRQLSENFLLGDLFDERHRLEAGLFKLIDDRRKGRKPPKQINTAAEYQIAAFMATATAFYKRLDSAGRDRLAGRLADGLQNDTALNSFCHEMTTATHFLMQGFDVDPHDLRNGGGFEYLVAKDRIEAEVECKYATPDIGRKIHRRHMLALGELVHRKLSELSSRLSGGHFINIALSGRLTPDVRLQSRIVDAVGNTLQSREPSTTDDFEVTAHTFHLGSSPFKSKEVKVLAPAELKEFVHRVLGKPNANAIAHVAPGRLAIVVVVESREPDDVFKGIYHQLRESANKQFSRTRPGVLVVRLPGLTDNELQSLASGKKNHPNVLQHIATRLFKNESRNFLHTVAYLAAGTISRSSEQVGNVRTTTISESGVCYAFHNDIGNGAAALHPYNFFSDRP